VRVILNRRKFLNLWKVYNFPISILVLVSLTFLVAPKIAKIPLVLLLFFTFDSIFDSKLRVPSILLLPVFGSLFAFLFHVVLPLNPVDNINFSLFAATVWLLFYNNCILNISFQIVIKKVSGLVKMTLPISILFIFLIVNEGREFLTRFMNGDARNVSLAVHNIVVNGYIPREMQGFYPSNFYFLNAASVVNNNSTNPLTPYLWGLALGFLACVFVIISMLYKLIVNLELNYYIGLLILCTPFFPQLLGFSLINGFSTGMWAIALLITLSINMHFISQDMKTVQVWSLLIYLILGIHIWAGILPVVFGSLVLLLFQLRKKLDWANQFFNIFVIFCLFVYTIASFENVKPANLSPLDLLRADGGIQKLNISFLLLLIILLLFMIRKRTIVVSIITFQLAIALTLYVVIGILRLPQSFDGYFNTKIFWIVFFSSFPLILSLIASRDDFQKGGFKRGGLLFVIAGLMANTSGIPLVSSTAYILGANTINPQILTSFDELNEKEDYVFWFYTDPPTDRIGTFWLSFRTNPIGNTINFNKIAVWAYGQTGRTEDLCSVISNNSQLNIITKFPQTVGVEISRICPEELSNYRIFQLN
jgi:hypothetical protein